MVCGVIDGRPMNRPGGDRGDGFQRVQVVDVKRAGGTGAGDVEFAGRGVGGQIVPASLAAQFVNRENSIGGLSFAGHGWAALGLGRESAGHGGCQADPCKETPQRRGWRG